MGPSLSLLAAINFGVILGAITGLACLGNYGGCVATAFAASLFTFFGLLFAHYARWIRVKPSGVRLTLGLIHGISAGGIVFTILAIFGVVELDRVLQNPLKYLSFTLGVLALSARVLRLDLGVIEDNLNESIPRQTECFLPIPSFSTWCGFT